MDWWQNILQIQGKPSKDDIKLHRKINLSKKPHAPDPEKTDRVMLIRNRLSRIYFLKRFFDYPVSLNTNTLKNLGVVRIAKIGFSYVKARVFPIKKEKSLEDFFINRFGKELYLTFFKDYTEKVWGVPCTEITSEWGRQRIKGLSVTKAVLHAIKNLKPKDKSLSQKEVETSLIEQFMYPKLGPGQLWEYVAKTIVDKGGEIHFGCEAVRVNHKGNIIESIDVETDGQTKTVTGDYFFSTMPVKQLIDGMGTGVPKDVKKVSQGLMYRDFITVGLLLKKLKIKNESGIKTLRDIVPDNWIYVQEREVKLGRIQIFNNWSPYLVKDENTVWIGLEYFCNEGDELWSKSDKEFVKFAIDELAQIGIIDRKEVIDSTIIRVKKTYPAYFGTYNKFNLIRKFTDQFSNLFLIGRNGMHRYNNTDHSMLTAMVAVENIINGIKSKNNIWEVNAEQSYHEKK
jgi:protoporphyrinogen oxidase